MTYVMGWLNKLVGNSKSCAACLYNPTVPGPQNFPRSTVLRLADPNASMLNPVTCEPVSNISRTPVPRLGNPGIQWDNSHVAPAWIMVREISFHTNAQYSNPCQASTMPSNVLDPVERTWINDNFSK